MTQREAQCLDFIRKRIEATGVSPSYQEICDELGLKSRGLVFSIVQRLLADGLLESRGRGRNRSLRLPGVNLRAVETEALVAELDRRLAA